ncbi:MAG: PQQ-binding-like beta-propeller repeat protein, partial [Candidatus Poribacteria bacterium]
MIKREKNEIINVWYQSSLVLTISAGIFSLVILVLLIFNYIQLKSEDPLNSPQLIELKEKLSREPANEDIKEQIRALDLQLRKAYFRHRKFSNFGSYLLIGSGAIFLVGIKFVYSYREKLPMPKPEQKLQDEIRSRETKIAVGIVSMFIFIGLILIIQNSNRDFFNDVYQMAQAAKTSIQEEKQQEIIETATVQTSEINQTSSENTLQTAITSSYPSIDEINKNWSRFRGPGGLGISHYSNVPSSWNGKTNENILWKTAIPLPGESSPIVWGKRVFVTGATESKREIYCVDADNGKILWQKSIENVPGSSPIPPKVSEETGYAAPTATTDGQRVYAIFANGDLVSFDFNGNLVWAKNLGTPKSMYGYASSLLMHKGLLIVLYDQGGTDENLSKIMAFDSSSGSLVWETKRPVPNSWATPIVINTGKRDELITTGNPWVISYNPDNGTELWRAKCLSGDIAPSPVFGD